MRDYLGEVAAALSEQVFRRIRLTTPALMLVGAKRFTPMALRDRLRGELAGKPRILGFDVYYPEELFEELLQGGGKSGDLLELENLLAQSVHAVVIVLESPGAIAELGAFANHPLLRDRLVVVVNEKHRHEASFIMRGPVNHLHWKTRSKRIFHDFGHADLGKLGEDVRAMVREVSKEVTVDTSVSNPLVAQHYLRAAIHVLQPVSRWTLQSLVEHATARSAEEAKRNVSMSLSILRREREVVLDRQEYRLTDAGRHRLRRMLQLERDGREMARALDRARINVLTWRLRHPQKLPA
jgi:hypothetical protein